jgi:hypothetical protein
MPHIVSGRLKLGVANIGEEPAYPAIDEAEKNPAL